MNLLKRLSFSLPGNILLWEIAFSLPLFLTFLLKSNSEGTLTFGWAIHIARVSSLGGVFAAATFWYAVALPLIKGRQDDQRQNRKRND
jgi:hypothetical protein